jgi:magnesium-transporting ATPase (P-type)
MNISQFDGKVYIDDNKTEPMIVDLKQFIYKGAVVKNSGSIFGLVTYTGRETKIMLNSGDYQFKLSRMESVINYCILFNMGVMFMIDFIMLVENHFFLKDHMSTIEGYLYPDGDLNYSKNTFFLFFSFFLILNNFVPLAMVVTQELFKILYTPLIECDIEMVNEEGTRHAEVHNMMLHEELGQINYMMCDKTGTLTQNELIFQGLCIQGKRVVDKADKLIDRLQAEGVQKERIDEFFLSIALNHDAIVHEKDGK